MALLNNDSTNSNENQYTNYEIVKELLHVIWKLKINNTERRILEYQIDQEFGYIKNGKLKDGDSHGYHYLTKKLGMSIGSKRKIIEAHNQLMSMNILLYDKSGYTNKYWINRDINTWII